MYPNWKKLVRNLRMHAAPRRLTSVVSILAAFTLLFSFVGSAQPVLAVGVPDDPAPHPEVNGLFWGDDDYLAYKTVIATGIGTDTVLWGHVYSDTLYVALVIDGNFNDNAFDAAHTPYMESAGWPYDRDAFQLMNSEFATFELSTCQGDFVWQQGYARQFEDIDANGAGKGKEIQISQSVYTSPTWVSDPTITTGSGDDPLFNAPPVITSSSSIVANLNNYANNYIAGGGNYGTNDVLVAPEFNMGVNCDGGDPCGIKDIRLWKSPFDHNTPDTVTVTGGFPVTITTSNPISYSEDYEWEWAMVYEWSVPLYGCDYYTVTTGTSHHSPSKTGPEDDPTPVTLTALAASQSTALLPIAGLLVGVGTIIVAPRRRRRRR